MVLSPLVSISIENFKLSEFTISSEEFEIARIMELGFSKKDLHKSQI